MVYFLIIISTLFNSSNPTDSSGEKSFASAHLTFPEAIQSNPNTVYIPFKLVGRLITVQAKIDTIEGNFFVDTGADKLVLNSNYYSQGTTTRNSESASLTGGFTNVRKKTIDTLYWDNLILENIQADILDLTHLEERKKIRLIGILGFSVFNDYEIFLDYQLGVVVLTKLNSKGDRIDPDGIRGLPYDSLSFELFGHAIVLSAEVNGVKLKFGLDSGAELNLLDRQVKRKVMKNFKVLKRVKMAGMGDKEVEMLAGILSDVNFGSINSKGMRTLLTNMDDVQKTFGTYLHGLVGYEFLFNKRTIINYKKKKLYFFKPQMS